MQRGSIATPCILVFPRHLLRHVKGHIVLIWDNLNTHKSAAVQEFARAHSRGLTIEYLPPYAPDLNPDEWVWRQLKHVELGNFAADDLDELKTAIRAGTQCVRHRPSSCVPSFTPAGFLYGQQPKYSCVSQ